MCLTAGHSASVPPRPYQELLGDDGNADSAAGRPLQRRGRG